VCDALNLRSEVWRCDATQAGAMSFDHSSVGQSQSRRYRSIRRVVVPTGLHKSPARPGWSETTRNQSTENQQVLVSCRFAALPMALAALISPCQSFTGAALAPATWRGPGSINNVRIVHKLRTLGIGRRARRTLDRRLLVDQMHSPLHGRARGSCASRAVRPPHVEQPKARRLSFDLVFINLVVRNERLVALLVDLEARMAQDLRPYVELGQIVAQPAMPIDGINAQCHDTPHSLKRLQQIEKLFEVTSWIRHTVVLVQAREYAVLRHPDFRVDEFGDAIDDVALSAQHASRSKTLYLMEL